MSPNRKPLILYIGVRLVLANDRRGSFALKIFRGGEPVAGGRRGGDTDFYGGARYDDRGGGAALHCWRPVSYGGRR